MRINKGLLPAVLRRGVGSALLSIPSGFMHSVQPTTLPTPPDPLYHLPQSSHDLVQPQQDPRALWETPLPHLSREATFDADENSPLFRATEASVAASSTFPLVERRTRPADLLVPPVVDVDVAVEALGLLREGGLVVTPFFDWSKYCKLPSLSSASCARVALGGVEVRG